MCQLEKKPKPARKGENFLDFRALLVVGVFRFLLKG